MADKNTVSISWNGWYIAGSIVTAYCCFYVANLLAEQSRILRQFKSMYLNKWSVTILMPVAIGFGIWCEHYIGMHAIQFFVNESGMKQGFDIKQTIGMVLILLFVSLVLSTIGVRISAEDRFYSRDRDGVMELLIQDAQNESIHRIRNHSVLWRLALLKHVHFIIIGGSVVAACVCIVQYLGIDYIVGNLKIKWQPGIVIASACYAEFFCVISFWLTYRLMSLYPSMGYLRIASSFLMTVGCCGTHYIAISAGKVDFADEIDSNNELGLKINSETIALSAATVVVLYCLLILSLIISDLHAWQFNMSRTVRETDKLLGDVKKHPALGRSGFLKLYDNIRKKYPAMNNYQPAASAWSVIPTQSKVLPSYSDAEAGDQGNAKVLPSEFIKSAKFELEKSNSIVGTERKSAMS